MECMPPYDNTADGLTKPLYSYDFLKFRDILLRMGPIHADKDKDSFCFNGHNGLSLFASPFFSFPQCAERDVTEV